MEAARRPLVRGMGVRAGTVLLLAALLAGCGAPAGPTAPASGPVPAASPADRPSGVTPDPVGQVSPVTSPEQGTGRWSVCPDGGPVAGTAGRLLRYRVAVEDGIGGVTAADFAARVAEVLGDARGWTGTGGWRLQLSGAGGRYDFTVY